MRDTVEDLKRLLAEEYVVVHIESDRGVVTTTLRRGGLSVVLHLSRQEAARLLFGPAPRRP